MNAEQQLPTRVIRGEEFFQLKCHIEDAAENELLTKGGGGIYTEDSFKDDFRWGRKGFVVHFYGTSIKQHFT